MGNRALCTSERHGFISSRQLCNSLLHNWILSTHLSCKALHTKGMQQAGGLL
jgi:hypothetical protein